MNFSAWNSIPAFKKQNPSLSPSHLIIEFERTKRQKIFQHKLGQVNFSREREINKDRQKIIDQEIGNITLDGFKYKNVGHVYSNPTLIFSGSGDDKAPEFEVYAHGHPLRGGDPGSLESCSRMGLQCADKEGTNVLCAPGKCIIGTVKRIKSTKWEYRSVNTYGPDNLPAIYYFPVEEFIVLKPILRGNYTTFGNDGNAKVIGIDKPASFPSKIYLSPQFYFSDDFIEGLLIQTDERLSQVLKPPTSTAIGTEQRRERFIRAITLLAYPNTTEGVISNQINQIATEELKDALITTFKNAAKVWATQCNLIIEEEFLYRFARQYSGVEYVSAVYNRIFKLFSGIIQVTESSLSSPKISYDKDRISRPVYSRLPGISEAYRSDPSFSENETPAQWLTSGADDFLSKKKDSIDSFYENYLDPETCSALVLDWLAQHVGLTGELWDTRWNRKIKEALIRNAFGWWDREVVDEFGNLTPKGSIVQEFPFTAKEWIYNEIDYEWGNKGEWEDALSTWGGSKYNLYLLKLDEIEKIKISEEKLDKNISIKYKAHDISKNLSLVLSTDTIKINKLLWNGLIEAKGSLLAVMFLVSVFGLKSHSAEELEIIDLNKKIFKPKSGLRSAEITALPLIPYKSEVIQVGTNQDAEIFNYTNQLIAGISRASSVEESRNIFFRVPYYYNRNGKSWDRTSYIARNWMPGNLNVRVQYPYLSADLWSVGDAFFEPDIIIED
jgi:hypothetical protein